MKLGEVTVSVDTQARGERLREVGLARSELAPQADEVAGLRHGPQGAAQRARGSGIRGHDQAAIGG